LYLLILNPGLVKRHLFSKFIHWCGCTTFAGCSI